MRGFIFCQLVTLLIAFVSVFFKADRPVMRELPDEHDDAVAQKRGRRARVQRLRTLHKVTWGEL